MPTLCDAHLRLATEPDPAHDHADDGCESEKHEDRAHEENQALTEICAPVVDEEVEVGWWICAVRFRVEEMSALCVVVFMVVIVVVVRVVHVFRLGSVSKKVLACLVRVQDTWEKKLFVSQRKENYSFLLLLRAPGLDYWYQRWRFGSARLAGRY